MGAEGTTSRPNANDYAKNISSSPMTTTTSSSRWLRAGRGHGRGGQEYPDIKFIGVDQFQAETLPNVAGLIFDEDKAGYLAGALAASLSESGTVASVLGTNLVPPVVAFKGLQERCQVGQSRASTSSTYHPGGLDMALHRPGMGRTTAKQAIDKGADVIFGAGGQTGNGALIGRRRAEVRSGIGVDSDQWVTVPEAHAILVSSAMKLIPRRGRSGDGSSEGAFPAAISSAPSAWLRSTIWPTACPQR